MTKAKGIDLVQIHPANLRDGQQCVIYAGGCLHIATYERGEFIVVRGKRNISIGGVKQSQVWARTDECGA